MASQSIPVDVAQLMIVAMGSARPKIKNRQTGEVATDQQGRPITVMPCALLAADESSDEDGAVDRIHTVADVPAIRRGTQVQVSKLVARPYAFKDASGEQRAGVTFWADAIAPVSGGRGNSGS